jgi:hypothetical protein
MDCFAEPVIGRRFAPTRWHAMTNTPAASYGFDDGDYFVSSANAPFQSSGGGFSM